MKAFVSVDSLIGWLLPEKHDMSRFQPLKREACKSLQYFL